MRNTAGVATLALWIAGSFAVTAQPATRSPRDPFVGRWELNLARTHYGGGAEPRRRETMLCVPAPGGTRCTIRSVRADGRTLVARFTARYDGAHATVTGLPEVNGVRLVRVDDSIVDATFDDRGRPVFAYRAVRSDDRRSLTIIAVDPVTRVPGHSVVVYDAR